MLFKRLPVLMISVILFGLSLPVAQAEPMYTDVELGAWYSDYVANLTGMGIVDGFPDGSFRPDETLNKDQFIKMIVTALGNKPENGTNYWASSYIDIAREIGLLKKAGENNLKNPLPRGEIAGIMSEALEIRGEDTSIDVCGLIDLYGYTPDEYIPDILKIHNAGIITGYTDGTFRYDTYITRAEACAVIHKLVTPITRREHQITSLTPVPVCYSKNRDSILEFLNTYEGNENCLFDYQNIESNGIRVDTCFNSNIYSNVVDSFLLMTDNVSYPAIKFKALPGKNIVQVECFNDKRMAGNSDYAMFCLTFYDAPSGYPEAEWGYDTMYLKLVVNRLSNEGLLDKMTQKPDIYYEYKIKGLMRLLYGIEKGDVFSKYILERYTELSGLKPGEMTKRIETLIYDGTELVLIAGEAGRQLTFTFSED